MQLPVAPHRTSLDRTRATRSPLARRAPIQPRPPRRGAGLIPARVGSTGTLYGVIARYCRGIDRLDMALVRSAYHPDGVDHHTGFDGGRDEFIDWVEPLSALFHGVVFGLVVGLLVWFGYGLADGLTAGLTVGLAAGLRAGRVSGRFFLAVLLFKLTAAFPDRPAIFLDWARDSGLLRVNATAYQFRHQSYQQWLLHLPDAAKPTAPDNG